jgi:hypothetical protein
MVSFSPSQLVLTNSVTRIRRRAGSNSENCPGRPVCQVADCLPSCNQEKWQGLEDVMEPLSTATALVQVMVQGHARGSRQPMLGVTILFSGPASRPRGAPVALASFSAPCANDTGAWVARSAVRKPRPDCPEPAAPGARRVRGTGRRRSVRPVPDCRGWPR